VTIPATPITAQTVTNRFGLCLPTTKLVDEIYLQADIQIPPKAFPRGDEMVKNDYFLNHNREIESALSGMNYRDQLIAGHKKDVVITNKLTSPLRNVAIYGWHERLGSFIQYLTTFHHKDYVDYSHGIRFISKTMYLDGKLVPIEEVLKLPNVAEMLSYEGVINDSQAYR
ncbi:MAG: hypothetical protein HQK54_14375, partial [Oligoflexales bacterium]|nr:hypothetical protein [Oligoflexales bacterium]